jgi:tight adherence protein C
MEQHHGLQLFTDREKDTRQQLTLAGYRSPATLGNFYILRTLLIILLTVAAILFQSRQDTWTLHSAILWFGSAYLAGMQLPRWFLLNRQARFQRLLSEALPDAIDLLIVCVQAGLGLNAALVRMAREIQHLHPVLFAEIDRLNAEIAAGQDRAEALRGLASRTGQQDIRALTSLLLQSLRFGTSITETLHVFGDELREKRLQRAEEQAAKMATKLVFPLIFCLLPAFLITAVGPGFLQIMRFFSH